MTQLDQLRQELAALYIAAAERIGKVTENTDGQIHLTKEQLKKLISIVQEQTIEHIKSEIDDMNFDDECVSLDFDSYSRQIEVELDEIPLKNEIKHHIVSPDEVTDSELDDLMNKVIEQDI